MTCDQVKENLPFFVYGELSFDEEENLEQHVQTCVGCARALAIEKAIGELASASRVEPPPMLLGEARRQLRGQLVLPPSTWQRVRQWFNFHPGFQSALKPLGAAALLVIGFFSARLTAPAPQWKTGTERVRFVESAKPGEVQLVIDEVRQSRVTGAMDDVRIRSLLLAAAKDPDDAGLRAEIMDLLKGRTESGDIRATLLAALDHDPNEEVRIKALEALRSYATHADVRRAISAALLNDKSAQLRTLAVDLLVSINQPDVAGTLQSLLERESNQYLRQRSQSALRAMKASTESF